MAPRFCIQVPAIAVGSGLPMSRSRTVAAEQAATSLLDTPAIDWLGNARSLRQVTEQIGRTHEIDFAARQLFFALVAEGITYRDYRERVSKNPLSVSEDAKRSVHYFHHVFSRTQELQSMGLGDGSLILARMNFQLEQQIKLENSSKTQVLQ